MTADDKIAFSYQCGVRRSICGTLVSTIFLEGGRVSPRTNTVRTQATSAQADGGICNTTLKLAIVDTTLLLAGPLDLAT